MRRFGLKIATLILGLTFIGGTVVDASGLHACRRHDALPPLHADAQAGGATALPNQGEHVVDVVAGHGGHQNGHEGPWTCLDVCEADSGEALANGEASLEISTLPPLFVPDAGPNADAALPGRPNFLLPYANGPPLAA